MNTYQIIPLALSPVIEVSPAAFYYKAYSGDMVTMRYGCMCLRCNETGELMMVDTGLASQEDMEKYNYPFRRMKGSPNLKSVMAEKGLDPKKVTMVVEPGAFRTSFYRPSNLLGSEKRKCFHGFLTDTEVSRDCEVWEPE